MSLKGKSLLFVFCLVLSFSLLKHFFPGGANDRPQESNARTTTEEGSTRPADDLSNSSESEAPPTAKKSKRPKGQTPWTGIALFAMAVATLLSVLVSFYLYRWRKVLLSKPHAMVPEKWGKYLVDVRLDVRQAVDALGQNVAVVGQAVNVLRNDLNQSTEQIAFATSKSAKENKAMVDKYAERIDNMIETFMTFQKALDEKDAEIRRFKKNYNAEVFKKFLLRFARVDQLVKEHIQEETPASECLPQVRDLLGDAFDECDVEPFSPPIGNDYRYENGIADNPKKRAADRPEDANKIVEVLEPGYRLKTNGGYETTIPAKVRIYSTDTDRRR